MAEIPRKIRREFSGGLDFRIHCVILDERNLLLYPISQGKEGFQGDHLCLTSTIYHEMPANCMVRKVSVAMIGGGILSQE